MKCDVLNFKTGNATEQAKLPEALFSTPMNKQLVHEVVTSILAARRSGSKQNKSRSDVSGGGKKPFRQKGTGRARAGTTRGPIWTGGGVTFAARPRDYSKKINRKVYRKALLVVLAELKRQDRLTVVDNFEMPTAKTKDFAKLLNTVSPEGKVLMVDHDIQESLYLASRNIYRVALADTLTVSPVDMLWADRVLITQAALKELEERLS